MKKLLLLFIFSLLVFVGNAQIQAQMWKGAGITHTKVPPTFTPAVTNSWVAIDSSTGYWWNWDKDCPCWREMGSSLQFTGTTGSPSYTPDQGLSRFALNSGDSLYAYQLGSWRHLNDLPNLAGYLQWSDTFNIATQYFVLSQGFLLAEVDGDPTNELQLLSISNDTIYLTSGGFVVLPPAVDTSGYNSSLTFANDTLWLTDDNSTLFAPIPLQEGLDSLRADLIDSLAAIDLTPYVQYSDSNTVFVTPSQLGDSLENYVQYGDSLTVFITPDQLSDSLAVLPDSIVSGYGVAGYLPQYFSATKFDTIDAYWLANYKRLGINSGNTPLSALDVRSPSFSSNYPTATFYDGVYSFSFGYYNNPVSSNYLHVYRNSSNTYYNNSSGSHNWEVAASTKMHLSSTGRLGIGITSPLAKNHTVGEGTTSSTTALLVENSAGTDALSVTDDGATHVNGNLGIAGGSFIRQDGASAGGWRFNVNDIIFYNQSNNGIGIIKSSAAGGGGAFAWGTTTPDASALMTLNATYAGFLPPRMTTAQRNAISSPATGLQVYNTTDSVMQHYTGIGWTSEENIVQDLTGYVEWADTLTLISTRQDLIDTAAAIRSDFPVGTTDLTIGGSGPTYTIESSTGADVTISAGQNIALSEGTANVLTIAVDRILYDTIYTATATGIANVASVASGPFSLTRVGNNVTFAGIIYVTPTAAANTTTTVGISIAIPSDFTVGDEASGTAVCDVINSFRSGIVQCSTGSDRLTLNFSSNTTSSTSITLTGQYKIQ